MLADPLLYAKNLPQNQLVPRCRQLMRGFLTLMLDNAVLSNVMTNLGLA